MFRSNESVKALSHAWSLVQRYGWNAMSYQILNPGMLHWFSADGNAVIGYVQAGRYRVVAGAPICAPEDLTEVSAAFAEETEQAGQRLCYFGAQDRLWNSLKKEPSSTLLLGAQPVWNPQRWAEIIARKSSLRGTIATARNKGVQVQQWTNERASAHPQLQACLRAWLAQRGLPPMGFLLEPNVFAHLFDRRVFVAMRAEQVVGFLVASPVPQRQGWLFELIIRAPSAPNGTNELLVDAAMRAVAEAGAQYVTLGLAPLAQVVEQNPPPAWHIRLLLGLVRAHARRFYNFAGLEHFKTKFMPEAWEPIYVLSEQPRFSIWTLYAIAWAFGGSSPIIFISRAILRAFLQELRWARASVRRSLGAVWAAK